MHLRLYQLKFKKKNPNKNGVLPSLLGIGDNDIYWTWLQCDQYSVFDTFHYHFITIQVSNNNIFGVKAAMSKIIT